MSKSGFTRMTEYMSPPVGQELIATLGSLDKSLLDSTGALNKEQLEAIVTESFKKDKPQFGVLGRLAHSNSNKHFFGYPLSESHLVIIVHVDENQEIEAFFDMYSCLGHKHGAQSYKYFKEKTKGTELSKMTVPIVIDPNVFEDKKKMAKYEKYMLTHSLLSQSKHPVGHISCVMYGGKDIIYDPGRMLDLYKEAATLDGKKRQFISHDFGGKAATAISVTDDIGEFEAFNMYPEHHATEFSACDLDGQSVEDKIEFMRQSIQPKEMFIFKEPIKGKKEVIRK